MLPSAAELVARFLKANDYTETLNAFIGEAGLAPDAGSVSEGDSITIEQILQEKKTFDLSINFEKLRLDGGERGWLVPSPSEPTVLSIPTKSNILSTSLVECQLPSMLESKAYFAATTADRRLHLFDTDTSALTLAHSYTSFVDSPILDLHVIQGKYLLAAFMSGKLLLYNTQTEEVLDERRDQKKYIVRLATWSVDGSSTIIASAGWDSKVYLYRLVIEGNHKPRLGEPIATLALLSIPETLLFVRSPDTLLPILLLSRRDSTFLYFYSVPSSGSGETGIELLGRQNLAPHSNAWVAFTPSDIQLSPHDDSLIAVATSSTPHMKLLIVRLLIPPKTSLNVGMESGPDPTAVTQASQTRANLLLQDKEEAAILININTMAPQTTYSTPCLAWRPDGSGVYVSSDDGIVRGFETTTGKYIATLEAHEPGSKLRCLWAGRVKTQTNETPCEEEFLLTGGFDQKLVLWRSS